MGIKSPAPYLPTVPPHEAARELRRISQHLLQGAAYGSVSQARRNEQIEAKNESRNKVSHAIQRAREAGKARRSAEVSAALDEMYHHLVNERSYSEWLSSRPARKEQGNLSELQRLDQLIQCLPTQPDLPKDSKDMVIRAIIALLRTHQIPGSENLTQDPIEPKEVTNGVSPAPDAPSAEQGVAVEVGA